MRTSCFLIVILFSFSCYSQSYKYRNYKYTWSAAKPEPIPLEEQYKNEDAVILDEHCIYNASGNQVPRFYYFYSISNYFYFGQTTQGENPVVQKHVRIKFLTRDGIKKYSKIILPESFDPASDQNSVRLPDRDSLYRPKGEFECIRYFAARIIKPDGKIVNAIVDESTQTEVQRVNGIDEKVYSWIFRIINLEENDELEMDYSYEGAYNIDPSQRIFFNGDLPKQNLNFNFRCLSKYIFMLTCHNGVTPSDSMMVTPGTPHYTEYYFSLKDLDGGIREHGARPHLELPYFTYYQHSLDFGIQNPTTKYITKPIAYPWTFTLLPYVGYQVDNLKLRLERRDRTTVTLNEFLETEKQKAHDTSFIAIAASIQHTLADEFNFEKDEASTIAGDAELEHLGKYVSNKILRQTSRSRIYRELLSRLDKDYYDVALTDKRIAEIDFQQYEPLTTLHNAFAIPFQNSFLYLYPKAYRFGYEANELPFYYENLNTILIPQHEDRDKQFQLVPDVNFIFLKTPFSGIKENVRSTNAIMNVSLDSMKLSCSARIKLSGQFSTLIRGYYMYGDCDTTVNHEYYRSLSDLADAGSKPEIKMISSSRQFPFEATFNMSFINHQNISKKNDIYSIELADFFQEVTDEKFTAVHRHLDYYTDFQFQDSYKYMVKFDRSIQLINADSLQKEIKNYFADYTLKTTQIDNQSILIEISYVVKSESVPASKTQTIADVFDAIKKLNDNSLKLKVQ
jgi:hypothetical protein